MAGMSTAAIESGAASDMAALGPVHAGAVVQTCPKVVLEIGVFFDGTGNNEQNAQTGGEGSYANARSNVSLLKTSMTTPATAMTSPMRAAATSGGIAVDMCKASAPKQARKTTSGALPWGSASAGSRTASSRLRQM